MEEEQCITLVMFTNSYASFSADIYLQSSAVTNELAILPPLLPEILQFSATTEELYSYSCNAVRNIAVLSYN